jgi:CRP/FNR family transcriptional regulator
MPHRYHLDTMLILKYQEGHPMAQTDFASLYEEVFPFWEEISDTDKSYICQNSYTITYPMGKNVHDGGECSGVILVRSGSLRVYMMSENGKDITLYRLHKGDMCMLSASCVLEAITFDVFIDADEDSECCVIGGPAFAAVSQRNPCIKIFALETAVSRFSDVMWVMQQILFMSMDKRLAIFLSDESARTNSDVISLTHEQIARYIGSAREVVSRMLKYFANEGIVEVSRKGIKILDRKLLRKLTY